MDRSRQQTGRRCDPLCGPSARDTRTRPRASTTAVVPDAAKRPGRRGLYSGHALPGLDALPAMRAPPLAAVARHRRVARNDGRQGNALQLRLSPSSSASRLGPCTSRGRNGGSALASELIWREIELTTRVKPVIVSMGDLAASGGYYISCNADKIFAEPNTITGSIGFS